MGCSLVVPSKGSEILLAEATLALGAASIDTPAFSQALDPTIFKRGRIFAALPKPAGTIAVVRLSLNGDSTSANYVGLTSDSNQLAASLSASQALMVDCWIDWIDDGGVLRPHVHGRWSKIVETGQEFISDIAISKDSTHQITNVTAVGIDNNGDADDISAGSYLAVYGVL